MDEPFLPWWSLVLLGMWAIALALWVHPSVHRETRLWAGLLTLVYMVLIFIALGGTPRTTASSESAAAFGVVDLFLALGIAISLTASVWSLGRVSLRCRRSCYCVVTLSNAIICFLVKQPEVAIGLLFVAGLSIHPLIRDWPRQELLLWKNRLAEFTQFSQAAVPLEQRGQSVLIGIVTGSLAFTILGTISFSLHVETNGAASRPRSSALPSRDQIVEILGKQFGSQPEVSLIDLALGARADLVVLMAVVVLIYLAMSTSEPSPPISGSLVAETIATDLLSSEKDQ